HPQVPGVGDADHLGVRHAGEALTRLVGAQVVVVFRDKRDQGTAELRPGVQVGVGSAVQGRGQQDRSLHGGVVPPFEGEFGAERPAHQPRFGQVFELGEFDGRGNVVAFGLPVAELSFTSAVPGGGASSVEPQYRDVGEGGQPGGRFADYVTVHHPLGGGEGVKEDDGRYRVVVLGKGEFADERQPVRGVQGDGAPPGGEHGARTDLHSSSPVGVPGV